MGVLFNVHAYFEYTYVCVYMQILRISQRRVEALLCMFAYMTVFVQFVYLGMFLYPVLKTSHDTGTLVHACIYECMHCVCIHVCASTHRVQACLYMNTCVYVCMHCVCMHASV